MVSKRQCLFHIYHFQVFQMLENPYEMELQNDTIGILVASREDFLRSVGNNVETYRNQVDFNKT